MFAIAASKEMPVLPVIPAGKVAIKATLPIASRPVSGT